mmetsp:Transcript_16776/g.23167  ORF Transcript_16776/g.23167 Transcript_16776/m.23167 type:complete len:210 (-) Transcript_16776:1033-1662(-)
MAEIRVLRGMRQSEAACLVAGWRRRHAGCAIVVNRVSITCGAVFLILDLLMHCFKIPVSPFPSFPDRCMIEDVSKMARGGISFPNVRKLRHHLSADARRGPKQRRSWTVMWVVPTTRRRSWSAGEPEHRSDWSMPPRGEPQSPSLRHGQTEIYTQVIHERDDIVWNVMAVIWLSGRGIQLVVYIDLDIDFVITHLSIEVWIIPIRVHVG